MQSKPKALRLTHPRSASAMPSPSLPSSNHRAQFIAARDTRNRRIPGLYIRGGRYYAQLWVDLDNGKKAARRFPLRDGDNQPVRTSSAARGTRDQAARTAPESPSQPGTQTSILQITSGPILRKQKYSARGPGTMENERQATERWRDHLG